jgi:hypothetical protein
LAPLAAVRDLRELRSPATGEELADYETDLLAGFVLARASAGLADSTIRNDTNHLELIRDWFGRPLWEMAPADADAYFGKVLREARPATRTGRAAALAVFFEFLELRHADGPRARDAASPACARCWGHRGLLVWLGDSFGVGFSVPAWVTAAA